MGQPLHPGVLRPVGKEWRRNLGEAQDPPSPRVVLITVEQSPESEDREYQNQISDVLGLPSWFRTRSSQEASGFFDAKYLPQVDGSEKVRIISRFLIKHVGHSGSLKHIEKYDSKGDIGKEATTDTIQRNKISYHWQRLSFIYTWQASKQPQLVCFLPANTLDEFQEWWANENIDMATSPPLVLLTKALEYVVLNFDYAVWSWRNIVRRLEERRREVDDLQKEWVVNMHEIARHAIHSSEMLEMALHVVDSLLAEVERASGSHNPTVPSPPKNTNQTLNIIRRQKTMLQCIHLRSQALEKRIQNEMALAFHLSARFDSQTAKTISVLGLLFLPGTFISAIFSMSFFNFTPGDGSGAGRWTMSRDFWIYWAVTIPVTAITVVLWYWWQHRAENVELTDKSQETTKSANQDKRQDV